jgi:hypothetical protein
VSFFFLVYLFSRRQGSGEKQIRVIDTDKIRELSGLVTFQAHDLFTPQTVEADLYYIRWVLHNWSDKYCIKVLRAQIPMLKPGVRILIHDTIMPMPGTVPRWRENSLRSVIFFLSFHLSLVRFRPIFSLLQSTSDSSPYYRSLDLTMASAFNAHERTLAEWKALITEADSGFIVNNVIEPEGSALSIIEILWQGAAEQTQPEKSRTVRKRKTAQENGGESLRSTRRRTKAT